MRIVGEVFNYDKRIELYASQGSQGKRRNVFKLGDWIWTHRQKRSIQLQRRSRFYCGGDGRFHVIVMIEDNGYNLDFQGTDSGLNPFNERVGDVIQERQQIYEDLAQLEKESKTRLRAVKDQVGH